MPNPTAPPPPAQRRIRYVSTRVGTDHGLPAYWVHPENTPAPVTIPACLPDCPRCTDGGPA